MTRGIKGPILVITTCLLFLLATNVTEFCIFRRGWVDSDSQWIAGAIWDDFDSDFCSFTAFVMYILYYLTAGMALLNYFLSVFSDPGALDTFNCPIQPPFVDPNTQSPLQLLKEDSEADDIFPGNRVLTGDLSMEFGTLCLKCGGRWKPSRAHHCATCNKCIFKMDHHCPWISNCIGFANAKTFMLFLAYTAALCIYTLLMIPYCGLSWLWSGNGEFDGGVLGCLCLLYLLACGVAWTVKEFGTEMAEAVKTNSTLVESYQETHGALTGERDQFEQIFGRHWWLWLIPVRTAHPDFTERVFRLDSDDVTETATESDDICSTWKTDAISTSQDSLGIENKPPAQQGVLTSTLRHRDVCP